MSVSDVRIGAAREAARLPPRRLRGGRLAALRAVGLEVALRKLRRRLWADVVCVGTLRDLAADRRPVEARVPLVFEACSAGDALDLDRYLDELRGEDHAHFRSILRTLRAAAGDPIVARTPDGDFVGLKFLHEESRREQLEQVARGMYPVMADGHVVSEGLYVRPRFRRLGVATALMDAADREAARRGYRVGFAMVQIDQVSLRASTSLGSRIAPIMRVDRYTLGRRRSVFRPLDEPTRARIAERGLLTGRRRA